MGKKLWIYELLLCSVLMGLFIGGFACGKKNKKTNTGSSGTTPTASVEPVAPTLLSATVISSTQIDLSWTDNSDNETGFKIERKAGAGGTYAQIATVGAETIAYSDKESFSPSTTYYYRMKSFNYVGDSGYSNEKYGTILPIIVETSPINNAQDVAITATITATFSGAMNPLTISATTFKLRTGANDVSGSVSYTGVTATFTPSSSLRIMATYTATITTGVQDMAGNPLAADYNWSFTIRNRAWGTAELIETNDVGDATTPHVAVDNKGNAIAVWEQYDGGRYNIWANRYVSGTGWGNAQLIETDDTGDAVSARVAVDPNGNAVAVWYQSIGITSYIWANSYISGTGWGTAQIIQNGAGNASYSQVAVDSNGNAIAVWHQDDTGDGISYNIWANRYVSPTWGTAQLIETNNGTALNPQVALDSKGNAIAVWEQFSGGFYHIYANRYVSGTVWTGVQRIDSSSGPASNPQVAVDPNGNAIAVWYQNDGSKNSIYANRYVSGTGWGATAQLIETENFGHAANPQVAIDPKGNAIAVWYQDNGMTNNIHANRYVSGTGWATAQLIETENFGHAANPQVAIDPNGNAVAIWSQSNITNNIYANSYISPTGWTGAQLIENDIGAASIPQVAVEPNGNAIAVWEQRIGLGAKFNTWANIFK